MTNKKELELYFHIPFCVKKCYYCDFLSAPATEETQKKYMAALRLETRKRAEEFGDYTVVSVFVGGGTPSVVDSEELAQLMQTVRDCFALHEKAEITVEVNPGTVDYGKLLRYRESGVNRLSIGLQSANDVELRRIGRIHTWKQFLEMYEAAVLVGFENINVDLMSTLPGQSMDDYVKSLEKVLGLKPQPKHISSYSLILEEGTALYEMVTSGQVVLPDEETDRLMYSETKKRLEAAGFRRYEISNYAVPGYECRHNCGYWMGTEYLGLGIGAASYVQGQRFRNSEVLADYLADCCQCREEVQVLTAEEKMEEFMFLGLRMISGVSRREFERRFGITVDEVYGEVIDLNVTDGLIEEDGTDILRLTEKGLDLSNYVFAQFLLS